MKLNKKYLAPLCSLFVTGGLLLSIAVLTLGSSFGWFSNNDKVSATGISVSSISPFKTEEMLYMCTDEKTGKLVPLQDYANATVFSAMLPGNQRTVYLKVTNEESDTALSLDLLLSAPSTSTDSGYSANVTTGTGENATTVTEYYYFGTQVRVSKIALAACTVTVTDGVESVTRQSVSDTDLCTLTGAQKFLLTMPDAFYTNGVQGVGATATQVSDAFAAASQKMLTGSDAITVAAEGTVWVAITFEFVENGQVQNPYIDFANKNSKDEVKKGFVLTREILCRYSEVTG